MGYLGSKAASGLFQAIIALMPPHDTYIELFCGSGVVLRRKPAAPRQIAVDLDTAALALVEDIPGAERLQVDALSFIDTFDFTAAGRTLIYADPPYLHSTRTSNCRYNFELSDADHVVLLHRLRALPASVSVILSGYPSALYDEHLVGWHTRQLQAMTRGGVRTEQLWWNFEPGAVQWAKYTGTNFTDRQRIKRKAQRWADNFRDLPPGEQLAVLAAIMLECAATPADPK